MYSAFKLITDMGNDVQRSERCMEHCPADLGDTKGGQIACLQHRPIYLFKNYLDEELPYHLVSKKQTSHTCTHAHKHAHAQHKQTFKSVQKTFYLFNSQEGTNHQLMCTRCADKWPIQEGKTSIAELARHGPHLCEELAKLVCRYCGEVSKLLLNYDAYLPHSNDTAVWQFLRTGVGRGRASSASSVFPS